jgi:hypothetical protein
MNLHVELDGEEIVVTRPGTDMMTGYRKSPDSPTLVLTLSWVEPTVSSPEISEFRAHAFQAAVSKARESRVDTVGVELPSAILRA